MRASRLLLGLAAPLLLLGCGSGDPQLPEGQSLDYPKGKDYSSKVNQAPPAPSKPAFSQGMSDQDRKAAIDTYVREQRAKAAGN